MAARRLALLVSILALIAVACGNESVVVTGPSLEPASGSTGPLPTKVLPEESASEGGSTVDPEIELAEDFTFDFSLLGDDDETEDSAGPGGDPEGDGEESAAGPETAPATLAFVRQAAGDTAASETYRFDVFFEMYVADGVTVFDVAPSEPLSQGAISADRSWVMTDMGAIFDAVFAAAGGGSAQDLLGADLSMEVIADGTDAMYIRAPLFASMAQLGVLPGADDLAALGDGWGFIDLSAATGLSAEELGSLTGAQTGASADDLLAMVDAIGGTVTEVGPADVRGVATTQFRAEVGIADVLDAQGMTLDDLGVGRTASIGDVAIPFDIFIDAEGRVRRMVVVIDTSVLGELIGGAPSGAEARISTVIELYGFGTDVDIVDPATLGAVDVTDAFIALSGG